MEERLKFFVEGGDIPKNEEVMDEVLQELRAENLYFDSEKAKLKKKKKAKVVE